MHLTAVLTPAEEGGYIALNPETGTTTQGESVEEALVNLREATALFLEEFPGGAGALLGLLLEGHPAVAHDLLRAQPAARGGHGDRHAAPGVDEVVARQCASTRVGAARPRGHGGGMEVALSSTVHRVAVGTHAVLAVWLLGNGVAHQLGVMLGAWRGTLRHPEDLDGLLIVDLARR